MSGGITNFNSFPPPFYLALRKLQSNFLCRVESQISILSHHLFISRYENCRRNFLCQWNPKFQFFPTTFLSRVTKIADEILYLESFTHQTGESFGVFYKVFNDAVFIRHMGGFVECAPHYAVITFITQFSTYSSAADTNCF